MLLAPGLWQYPWCPERTTSGISMQGLDKTLQLWTEPLACSKPPWLACEVSGFHLLQGKVSHCYPPPVPPGALLWFKPHLLRPFVTQCYQHSSATTAMNLFCSCGSAGGADTFLLLTEVTSWQSPPFPNTTILPARSYFSQQLQAL